MLNKGQTQQIFVWLVVLVIAVSILFFGIKLIKKTEDLKDDALIVKFFKSNSSMSDKVSPKNFAFGVPSLSET